jgi:hypothetical protein
MSATWHQGDPAPGLTRGLPAAGRGAAAGEVPGQARDGVSLLAEGRSGGPPPRAPRSIWTKMKEAGR